MSAVPSRSSPGAIFTVAFWLALAATAGYTFFASHRKGVNDGVVLRNYRMVEDFCLTTQHDKPLRRADLEGKVWVAEFIFTSCTAECPILSLRMADLQKRFAGNPDVAFVSFSVDPHTDTPERLARYASRYGAGPNWWFLTGDTREIDRLVKGSFLLPLARNDAERSQIFLANLVHSERFAVVDRLGVVRSYAEGLAPGAVEAVAEAVTRLLAEGDTGGGN